MLSSFFLSTLPARWDQEMKGTLIRSKNVRSYAVVLVNVLRSRIIVRDLISLVSWDIFGTLGMPAYMLLCEVVPCPAPDSPPDLAELSIHQWHGGAGANSAPGWPSNWKSLLREKAHGGLIDGAQGQHIVLTLPASWGSSLTHNGIVGSGSSTCVFLNLFCLSVFLCLSYRSSLFLELCG